MKSNSVGVLTEMRKDPEALRKHLREHLEREGGSTVAVARKLSVSRACLCYYLKDHGLGHLPEEIRRERKVRAARYQIPWA